MSLCPGLKNMIYWTSIHTLIQQGQQISNKSSSFSWRLKCQLRPEVGTYTLLLQVLNPEYGPLSPSAETVGEVRCASHVVQ